MRASATEKEEENRATESNVENFRGALKALTLTMRVPIQIVWPTTYDNDAVVKRKLAEYSTRKVQDEATRAWNFFCALYYKSGGTPWRMVRDQREYSATFMGVSFYENLDGASLQTSSAQLFDERGEGLILKGGPGLKDKADRQPYLSAQDAFDLTRTALQSYKKEHGNYPARLVIHKTSRFHAEESRASKRPCRIPKSKLPISSGCRGDRLCACSGMASIPHCVARPCGSMTNRPYCTRAAASISFGHIRESTCLIHCCFEPNGATVRNGTFS